MHLQAWHNSTLLNINASGANHRKSILVKYEKQITALKIKCFVGLSLMSHKSQKIVNNLAADLWSLFFLACLLFIANIDYNLGATSFLFAPRFWSSFAGKIQIA